MAAAVQLADCSLDAKTHGNGHVNQSPTLQAGVLSLCFNIKFITITKYYCCCWCGGQDSGLICHIRSYTGTTHIEMQIWLL